MLKTYWHSAPLRGGGSTGRSCRLALQTHPLFAKELMKKILSILRCRMVLQELITWGVQVEAHMDDVCAGTNTKENHLFLWGEFFAVCKESHTRLKVNKCEFKQETMQYLGFDIGCGRRTPAPSKAKHVMHAKARHEDPQKRLHDVRRLIEVSNFYRRCMLTNLIKKFRKISLISATIALMKSCKFWC